MRIVFDILGSTERSGGMRLHSTQLLTSWLAQYPADDVVIVGGEWATREFEPRGATVVSWRNEAVTGRCFGQLVVTPLVALRHRAQFVVSLSPIVSPLVPKGRAVCFQHDWRHMKNPGEFPIHQRLYRKLWQWSARHAFMNVCISDKAAAETRRYVSGAATVVVENGRDHARSWHAPARRQRSRHVVTFGHHNNKRPELLIDAFVSAEHRIPDDVSLVILGARGDYAEELRSRANATGLSDRVALPGFVRDDEYQRLVATSAVVAMASSDEGFGLPIAEAQYFGIPALVTSDSGMPEIFGDYPFVADPEPSSIAEALNGALASERSGRGGRDTLIGWDDTATGLRERLRDAHDA